MLLAVGKHFGKFTVNIVKVVFMHGIFNNLNLENRPISKRYFEILV